MEYLLGLIPIAFIHGVWASREHFLTVGAERMYDTMWEHGTPHATDRNIRVIELERTEEMG